MERKLLVKVVLVSAASVVLTLLVIVGVAWAGNIFQVDRDGTVRLVITDAGNVGIGTTSPGALLHVQTATSQEGQYWERISDDADCLRVRLSKARGTVIAPAIVQSDDALGYYLWRGHNGSAYNTAAWIGGMVDGTPGLNDMPTRLVFATTADGAAGSSVRMTIKNNGNVGIGRTPTANILEIEGNASKTAAGSWLANSDRRIKTDIRDITDALETIERLRPVKFRYTNDYRAQHPSIEERDYENFIAQEFRQVFPECVKDDGTGLLQIDTYNVIPTLVAAVQELIRKNEEMETKIRMLEEKMKGGAR